jgi:methyl-accepting chemotaxis protein
MDHFHRHAFFMKNWTIGKRITTGGLALCLLLALIGAIAWFCLAAIRQDANLLKIDVMPGTINSAGFRIGQGDNFIRTLSYAQATTPAEREKRKAAMDATSAQIGKYIAAYEATITTAEDRELFGKLNALREAYRQTRGAYLKLSDAGKVEEADHFLHTELMSVFQSYINQSQAIFDFNALNGGHLALHIDQLARTANRAVIWISGAALVFAGVFGFFIIRSTNRALGSITEQIRSGADHTASAAGQVAVASQSLAEGSTEQAASLQQTSASLEEISSMTKRNAESATKAKELSHQTRRAAETGATSMAEMKEAMDGIKNSAANIAKIVKTIDEIAFQTNILALNAAVEAARAGEAGAGFAVVADEVRSLAQRSARSAKETAEKIEESVSRSERGVLISQKVAEGFEEIVVKARQVDDLVAEIATASTEQTQGITQVSTAVSQMDKVTQSNAAGAEESASASEELNSQAEMMREAIRGLERLIGAAPSTFETSTDRDLPTADHPARQPASPRDEETAPSEGSARRSDMPTALAQRTRDRAPTVTLDGDAEHDRFFN